MISLHPLQSDGPGVPRAAGGSVWMAAPACSVRYFCLGALLIFLGSVLLCALGFTIVLPHEATSHWPGVTCKVYNATYDSVRCSCDQKVGSYLCMSLDVDKRGLEWRVFPNVISVKLLIVLMRFYFLFFIYFFIYHI